MRVFISSISVGLIPFLCVGRSSLVESLVWLISFLRVKRREKREERREKREDKKREEARQEKRQDEEREREMKEKMFFFFDKMFQDPHTRQMNWPKMFR